MVVQIIKSIIMNIDNFAYVYRKNNWSYDQMAAALLNANEPNIKKLLREAFWAGWDKAYDTDFTEENGYDEQLAFELFYKKYKDENIKSI